MSPSLREDIRQTAPFRSLEQEAMLNVVRTAAQLEDGMDMLLKPYGIGTTQYNVLRILRGSDHEGLCRNDLRSRMLTRMPDMTRLLDRMEDAGLVSRTRGAADRRVVNTQITAAGRKLLDELDGPVEALHERQLGHLEDDQLRALIELLTRVRSACTERAE